MLLDDQLLVIAASTSFHDSYQSAGQSWTLVVSDDGVGTPAKGESQRAGLGASIIQALARQLHDNVRIPAEKPGTRSPVVGQ